MKCEKCGTKMEFKIEGHTKGWFCKKCGDAIVTSHFSDLEIDAQIYDVYVKSNNKLDIESVKIVSEISGLNYIKAKDLLEKGGLLLNGLAIDIDKDIKVLKKSYIKFYVQPNYPY